MWNDYNYENFKGFNISRISVQFAIFMIFCKKNKIFKSLDNWILFLGERYFAYENILWWLFYSASTNKKRVSWLAVQKIGLPLFSFFLYNALGLSVYSRQFWSIWYSYMPILLQIYSTYSLLEWVQTTRTTACVQLSSPHHWHLPGTLPFSKKNVSPTAHDFAHQRSHDLGGMS